MNTRFYSITNMYTSGIHAGIQTAHAVHQMALKYQNQNNQTYQRWIKSDKTIIVLNGGYQSNLIKLFNGPMKFLSRRYNYPIVSWRESNQALNGALTAVAIIVPEQIWSYPSMTWDPIKNLELAR